ncbi:hypothetical protein ABZ342_03340 [Amycolatopsis sp. NPDC005961]|uniref:hypothetical protein n=1 Tax=Amycolatopsis sp. NPDC005961 TaxID=3156720 RepID=UPI0033EBD2F3
MPDGLARWLNVADRDDLVAARPDLTALSRRGRRAGERLHGGQLFESSLAEDWRREILELSTSDRIGVVNPDVAPHITAVALQVNRREPSRPVDLDVRPG